MSKVKMTEEERDDALKQLRKWLKPGATVYCILRHRSLTGMSRRISLVIVKAGDVRTIDHEVAGILGYSMRDREEGIVPLAASPVEVGVEPGSFSLFDGGRSARASRRLASKVWIRLGEKRRARRI